LSNSETERLSVALVDVLPGHETDFQTIAAEFEALLAKKRYGTSELVRDEGTPLRYYSVRHWSDASAAEQCHGDPDAQSINERLLQIARVTHVVNGVRKRDPMRSLVDERRALFEPDRRSGFDRRVRNVGPPAGTAERRSGRDRRMGPRRLRGKRGEIDIVAAARRAREYAEAGFSHFKVGAAVETGEGEVFTGCNIENATYGLTLCAERVAIFKALSEGHHVFTRIAIVADTESPTPPCGACRQILWEFGGNLEIHLANLSDEKGKYQLKDLLPLPFDARLL